MNDMEMLRQESLPHGRLRPAPHFPEQDFAGVRHSSSAEWALYGQVAVPMRVPDAGRLPRNIFHPVQIGCELACLRQQSQQAGQPPLQ